ncbi:unnamed protein product [Miscanthus lutarioriparius]|uniref:Uncharacterized protein n=1 Tax=Miscanthus lutarioriparius TaxID=422564 RepID=A0A811QCI0_9POAL|nr:unnamed protein product [Miscanthus lutarioriparius]
MRQWKSLVPALHLHGTAASCFPHPPSSPSPPAKVVRLVGCDGRVRAYTPPVTARELMQEHPRHLVCRADALLIGEKIPAVAAGEELQPGEAYFLLPAHLFRSVLSFVSLASSLMLLLLSSSTTAPSGAGKKPGAGRPFELHRTASGTLQIKFSDDFLLAGGDGKGVDDDDEADADAQKEKEQEQQPAVLLRGDDRLAKDYEELVGYGKSRRWAPKLETIQEVVAPAPAAAPESADPAGGPRRGSRRSRALPFLGSRRRLLRLGREVRVSIRPVG